MDDYMDNYGKRMDFYADLYAIRDQHIIDQVIAGDDKHARAHLASNPFLSYESMEALSKDKNSDVRLKLAESHHLPPAILQVLSHDNTEAVRASAISNPLTCFSDFKQAVIGSKFNTWAKTIICSDLRVTEDVEIFEYLWENIKGSQPTLIEALDYAQRQSHPGIDNRVPLLIHDELRTANPSNATREAYAGAVYVALPEILDQLKDDPHRPVINAIARNGSAWVSTHEYLISQHKSSGIRTTIVAVTEDNDLLNKIYHGTKSKDIRYWVEQNSHFVLK